MACDLLREIHEGGLAEDVGTKEGPRVFIVHMTANEREDEVLALTGIPQPRDGHPTDPYAICRRRVPNRMGQQAKGMWRVECFYSNAPLSQREEERILIANPTLRPAVVDSGSTRDEVPCTIDRNGVAYKNSANDAYDPSPSKMRSRIQFSVRKNYATVPNFYYDLPDTINYHDLTIGHGHNRTFNRATMQFVPAGTSEQASDNGISYVEVRFTLDYRESFRMLGVGEKIIANTFYADEARSGTEEAPVWSAVSTGSNGTRITSEIIRRRTGWDREILDAGYYCYGEGGDGLGDLRERERFTDINGGFSTIPQFLNGDDGQRYATANYNQYGDYFFGDFRVLAGILS